MANIRDRYPFPASGKTHASHHADKSRSFSSPKANTCSHPTQPKSGPVVVSACSPLNRSTGDVSTEKKPSRSPGLVHQPQLDVQIGADCGRSKYDPYVQGGSAARA